MARTTYSVRVAFESDDMVAHWDGDMPLDPKRKWAAYTVFIAITCGHCQVTDHEDELVTGNVWLSADAAGERHLLDVIRDTVGKRVRKADIHILYI